MQGEQNVYKTTKSDQTYTGQLEFTKAPIPVQIVTQPIVIVVAESRASAAQAAAVPVNPPTVKVVSTKSGSELPDVREGSVEREVHDATVAAWDESQWPAMQAVVERESGFNPYAKNPSSGACGLAQAEPCSKLLCALSDVPCQIQWVIAYVKNRYDTPEGAEGHEITYGWY